VTAARTVNRMGFVYETARLWYHFVGRTHPVLALAVLPVVGEGFGHPCRCDVLGCLLLGSVEVAPLTDALSVVAVAVRRLMRA